MGEKGSTSKQTVEGFKEEEKDYPEGQRWLHKEDQQRESYRTPM